MGTATAMVCNLLPYPYGVAPNVRVTSYAHSQACSNVHPVERCAGHATARS
eukprot:CAMPEP_0202918590 /NCGR_PEP_ID=MMETSP1392-20130828/73823_1 /ASSEMBLY_ACC=CAM_ASM_000868 /TAXON_ID=225041 /ORGANISM="Chlamydomonas chlamydogama, Strain SAG 11-48b" /LENGTH=50 /DNA_ID=CAMNT_0049611693 /DNA_START=237 /DNA_END=389 /DNA_ORIENTATION=-